jgi:tetratricopeptide (TPR) repeat protein
MMRFHYAWLGTLAVLAAISSYWLLPNREERAAMYLRDGNRSAAIVELEAIVAGDRGSVRLKHQLASLYEEEGRIADGIGLLRQVARTAPKDAAVWRKLATLYELDGDDERAVVSLDRALRLKPDEQAVRKLIGIYRVKGDADSELALLERFAHSPFLHDDERKRLGSLLHARGRYEAAISILAPLNKVDHAKAERARLTLFDALIRTGRVEEAATHAQRWLSTGHLRWYSHDIVLEVARAAPPAKAVALIEPLVGKRNRELNALVDLLIDQRYWRVARGMLARLIEQQIDPSFKELVSYVSCSRRIGDQSGPLRAFAKALDGGMTLDAQARFAEALVSVYGPSVLSPFYQLFSGHALSRRPLFAARLAVTHGNTVLAKRYLLATDVPGLTSARRRIWLGLAEDLLPIHTIFQRLEALHRSDRLPSDLRDDFVRISALAGQTRHRALAWRSLSRHKP